MTAPKVLRRRELLTGAAVLATLPVLSRSSWPQPRIALDAPAPARPEITEPPVPPPDALQHALFDLVEGFGGDAGVAVYDLKNRWLAGVEAVAPFPQQSVSKLWVAIAFLDAVDRGDYAIDGEVTLTDTDRSVFFQPLTANFRGGSYTTTIADLLERAVVRSDNAANDKLMRLAGGPDAIDTAMRMKNLPELGVGAYERDLQAQTAGLVWAYDYGFGQRFEQARARLPRDVRQAAAERYLEDPLDGAAPVGIVKGLTALAEGRLLSEDSTDLLLTLMAKARTGPRRLRGGLPPGWHIAHKTGTGQDWAGGSMGINDVGLMRAPDGRLYAVAVMIRCTRKPVSARLEFMQGISRAIALTWSEDTPDFAVADPAPARSEPADGALFRWSQT